MNYFKPKIKYYIIPILRIDDNIILGKEHSLYEYVKKAFPILRQLEDERLDILYGGRHKTKIAHLTDEYKEHVKFLKDSLEHLNLPEHILLFENNKMIFEPVTGKQIFTKDNDDLTLKPYRVSDCELEKYYISSYDSKIRNFFKPDMTALSLAHKPKEEFEKIVKISTKQNVKKK